MTMKLPLTSCFTSSQRSEHCRSGRIRVAFMIVSVCKLCSVRRGPLDLQHSAAVEPLVSIPAFRVAMRRQEPRHRSTVGSGP